VSRIGLIAIFLILVASALLAIRQFASGEYPTSLTSFFIMGAVLIQYRKSQREQRTLYWICLGIATVILIGDVWSRYR
jgi:hypothetical protein